MVGCHESSSNLAWSQGASNQKALRTSRATPLSRRMAGLADECYPPVLEAALGQANSTHLKREESS